LDVEADHTHAKIKGIMIGNRIGGYFGREGLSAGLVGEPVDGIVGYDPNTGAYLMAAMLMNMR